MRVLNLHRADDQARPDHHAHGLSLCAVNTRTTDRWRVYIVSSHLVSIVFGAELNNSI